MKVNLCHYFHDHNCVFLWAALSFESISLENVKDRLRAVSYFSFLATVDLACEQALCLGKKIAVHRLQ